MKFLSLILALLTFLFSWIMPEKDVITGGESFIEDSIPSIEVPYERNYIYIEGANLNVEVTIGQLTQADVDKYDVIYVESENFVLGHNYNSLRSLHKTKIGAKIYLSINGNLETYQVKVSEYAIQNADRTDIIGAETGTSIWDNYNNKTLRLYTCYGYDADGRWMVLAEKI